MEMKRKQNIQIHIAKFKVINAMTIGTSSLFLAGYGQRLARSFFIDYKYLLPMHLSDHEFARAIEI